MPEDVEANGTEVSDAMSDNENEYDDMDQTIKDEDAKLADQTTSPEVGTENSGEVKKKYDPKDPHRPRRKKARRACYACQRAHLTCGESQSNACVFTFSSQPVVSQHPHSRPTAFVLKHGSHWNIKTSVDYNTYSSF